MSFSFQKLDCQVQKFFNFSIRFSECMEMKHFYLLSIFSSGFNNILPFQGLLTFEFITQLYILTITPMKLKQITHLLSQTASNLYARRIPNPQSYNPTPYMSHPFLQSIYTISQPLFPYKFKREKLFFQDGGHISLDWSSKNTELQSPPILFVMHGLTGGSEMNYVKALVTEAENQGFCCVALNSRGINNEMTSPIPFTAMEFGQLEAAMERIAIYYPKSPIYIVGTSFGGNYLLRYLIRRKISQNIKGLVALAAPINVRSVVDDMGSVYQKFFIKRYIEETVTRHKEMLFWEKIGLVDLNQVKKSKNLREFHTSLTAKILGFSDVEAIFESYTITPQEIESLSFPTLLMVAKDDPIVSYRSMPIESITKNQNITFYATEKGSHLCWFQGYIPKRWYPKPVLNFINKLRTEKERL